MEKSQYSPVVPFSVWISCKPAFLPSSVSAASRAAVSAATASALLFSAVSILSQLSLNSSTRMRSVPAQRDSVMTHAVTHEQKKRGGNSGTKRIHGCGNPAANPLYSPKIP